MEYTQNYDYPAIGKRIKALRTEQKMSQQTLADMLEKSLRTVQKYESGEIEISIATVNRIAAIFQSTPTFILGHETSVAPVRNMGDIVEFLFRMEALSDISFSIDVKKPPHHDEWACAITFNGKDHVAESNADLCLFMERWKEEREDFMNGRQSSKSYELWKSQMVARYAPAMFKDPSAAE